MTTKLNINAINDSSITFDKLANDVVMDWDAKNGEKGYIDNRTHYTERVNGYLKFSHSRDVDEFTPNYRVEYVYASCEDTINKMPLKDTIIIHSLGIYYLESPIVISKSMGYGRHILHDSMDSEITIDIVNYEGGDYVEFIMNDDYGDLSIEYVQYTTLDEKYIPDTIARTSQIPTKLPADGGHADSSYMANRLDCPDTRNEEIVPSDTSRGLWTDFKQKNVTGLSAEYSGVISYRPYAQAGDWTGGPMHNLAFDENGIHHRKSNSDGTGWQDWRQIPYRDEVERCPEYHRAEDELNIEDCTLYDPNTGDYIGSYYGTHNRTDVIFDYKYVGGNFEDTPNSYGGMLTFPWQWAKGNTSPNYASQLFIPHGDEEDGAIKFRTSQSEEWNSWRKVIDNENYTEYAAKHDHKHNVTAAGNVSLSGSVDSNGILTISATFTGTQVKASTPTT